jgi:hypothetical protein
VITFNKKVDSFEELTPHQREHAYFAASFAATILFENTGAIGTNIIVLEHPLRFLVVAQFEDESHSFLWEPLHIKEDKMKEIASKIKDKCDYIGVAQPSQQPLDLDKTEVIEEKSKKDHKEQQSEEEQERKRSVESQNEEKEDGVEEDTSTREDIPKEPVDEKVRVIEKNYLLDQLRRRA